jgi:hypothetical protein
MLMVADSTGGRVCQLKAAIARDMEAGDWRAEAIALMLAGRADMSQEVLKKCYGIAEARAIRRYIAFQNLGLFPCTRDPCDFHGDGPAYYCAHMNDLDGPLPDAILARWGMRVWGPRGGNREL